MISIDNRQRIAYKVVNERQKRDYPKGNGKQSHCFFENLCIWVGSSDDPKINPKTAYMCGRHENGRRVVNVYFYN